MGLLHPPDQSLLEGTIIYGKGKQCIFLDKVLKLLRRLESLMYAGDKQGWKSSVRRQMCLKCFPFSLMKPYAWIS